MEDTMSSCYDAGYYAEEAQKAEDEPCKAHIKKKNPDLKGPRIDTTNGHSWVLMQSGWTQCEYCGVNTYSK